MIAPLGSQRIRPGADGLADGEQLELLAEHAVVAALGSSTSCSRWASSSFLSKNAVA